MGYVGYIYKITNKLNGHAYIGKTVNLKARWRDHKNKRSGTLILSKAFEKYGLESFTFEVLLTITSEDKQLLNQELLALEMIYIEKYNTFKNGYNATLGGDARGTCQNKDKILGIINDLSTTNMKHKDIGKIRLIST